MAYEWRKVMRSLAREARLIAPDLRGYGASDLSRSGRSDLARLTDDVDEVIDALVGKHASVTLVAHDWGGVIAWRFAETRSARVSKMILANAPHANVYVRQLLENPRQVIKSWYVFLMQLPRAERLFGRDRAALFNWMLETSGPHAFDDEELDLYRDAAARPGRTEAILAYYREIFPRSLGDIRAGLHAARVDLPIVHLWGDGDLAIDRRHPDAIRPFAPNMQVRRLEGVSHWVPEERPDEIVREIRAAITRRIDANTPSS
jgi:pimeloyl-ACP methyl ester carboxylesterase